VDKVTKDHQLDENFFLAALRDGGTFSVDYRSLYGKPDRMPTKSKDEEYEVTLDRFVSGNYATPTTGGERVSDLLRRYTDEWLDTGIAPDGKESPFSRKLTGARVAWAAVWEHEYSTSWGSRIDWDNGIERSPIGLATKLSVTAHPDREPLRPAMTPFAPSRVQRPATTPLPATGDRVVDALRERRRAKLRDRTAKQTPSTQTHPNMPEDVVSAANLRAVVIFHAFMKASWRYRLGKCKRCQEYFVLKVNPSKLPYARGMHCPNCKNAASAEASAKAKRADREQKLLGLAADVWSSWRPAPQFSERNKWIAERVNQLLGEKKAIQRNWVTRHEKEIAAELKRRTRVSTPEAVKVGNLAGTIKRFRGPGSRLEKGKGIA
jgi:hypothetical protein